jgi:eukaryotic-like serine/threonine-protein kinase
MSDSITRAWQPAAGDALTDRPTIHGFEICEELGRGGMGVVFKARQVASQRWVALKVMRDGALAGPQERARFRIEAEAAARMSHPNIVEIYEVDEYQGRPYFAMELVEGGSLDQRFNGRPQPARLAAQWVSALALAVEHAHAQKIVHRDLKPANVLLSPAVDPSSKSPVAAAAGWIPKIADFGLAKRLDRESSAWTQAGAIVGTASYMAPEQAAGRTSEIGPAVDIYALGAILYELLSGRPPFQADSWSQFIQQVLCDEPAPPTRLEPSVPPELETVCLKCLEKDPQQRYAAARELADDLSRFLAGEPIAATPLGPRERLTRLAARDDYQIVDEIGRGPASTVYRALYGPLKQPIALKVFSAGLCTREQWEEQLQRGAEVWAVVAHPHIVPVQRTGWWDGRAYVAAEFAPHGSLADNLSGRPYEVRHALELVEQLAEVVSYLHRQGVVHGNLKPSNVLRVADGIPRLIDLHPTGALFLGAIAADDAAANGLAYLAPELIEEPRSRFRPNTDVYGLGLILYELLTGMPAFSGATANEILERMRRQDLPAPSRFNHHIPPALDVVVLKCLRTNPWRRYSRVYDLLRRLRDLREHPAGHSPTGDWSKLRPPR